MTTEQLASLNEKLDALLSDPSRRRWLTIEEGAAYTGLSLVTFSRLLDVKITAYRPTPGRVVVDRLQLDSYQGCAGRPKCRSGRKQKLAETVS